MRALLFQLDGKIPNLALMRIAAHHRDQGDEVELRRTGQPDRSFAELSRMPDRVYASVIFEKSRFVVDRLLQSFPQAIVGGTGVDGNGELPHYRPDMRASLDDVGIVTRRTDYTDYPAWPQSIGFTQRGCRLKCGFCVVPKKEGKVKTENTIHEIWRGEPRPRQLILLDNDFFGQEQWRERIREIREGGFKVSFNQGINARFLTDEAAEAIASVDYRDDGMQAKRIYTAWDNRKDEKRLFDGLNRLVKYGVKPDHIMVYVLIGYWPGETEEDRLFRVLKLREFGARPYPMPYERTPELVWFQRWCIAPYDKQDTKSYVPWPEFKAAQGEPRKLGNRKTQLRLPIFDAA